MLYSSQNIEINISRHWDLCGPLSNSTLVLVGPADGRGPSAIIDVGRCNGLDDPSRKVLVTHLPIYKLPSALLNVLIDLVDGIY